MFRSKKNREYKIGSIHLTFAFPVIKAENKTKNYNFNILCSEKNYKIALAKVKQWAIIFPKSKQKIAETLKPTQNHRILNSHAGLHSSGVNFSSSVKMHSDENFEDMKTRYKKATSEHKNNTQETTKNVKKSKSLKTHNIEPLTPIIENPIITSIDTTKSIKTLDTKNKIVHLYIFRGYLTLSRERLRDYNLIVYDIIHNFSYEIFVTYDFISGKIYMSYEQYLYYRKYRLNAKFTMTNTGTQLIDVYDSFSSVSELALYGYSVGYTSYLTENDRHKILAYLIDNNIMKPYSIISHLQGQIRLKEKIEYKDYSRAIREWKNDIRFVDNYSKKSDKIETKSVTIKEDYFIIED